MQDEYFEELDLDIARFKLDNSRYAHGKALLLETLEVAAKMPNIALFTMLRSLLAVKRGTEDTIKFLYNAVTKHKKLEELIDLDTDIEKFLNLKSHNYPKLYQMQCDMNEAKKYLLQAHQELKNNPDIKDSFLFYVNNFYISAKEYYKERDQYLIGDALEKNSKLLKALDHHKTGLEKEYRRTITNEEIYSLIKHPRKNSKKIEIGCDF